MFPKLLNLRNCCDIQKSFFANLMYIQFSNEYYQCNMVFVQIKIKTYDGEYITYLIIIITLLDLLLI